MIHRWDGVKHLTQKDGHNVGPGTKVCPQTKRALAKHPACPEPFLLEKISHTSQGQKHLPRWQKHQLLQSEMHSEPLQVQCTPVCGSYMNVRVFITFTSSE